jgi:hypothetical protein
MDEDVFRKQSWSMTHLAFEKLAGAAKWRLLVAGVALKLLSRSANEVLLDRLRRPGLRLFFSQYEYRPVPRPEAGMSLRLLGLYQNARYFASYLGRLRESFACPSGELDFVEARLEEQRRLHPGRPLVGLHVRRGDFLSWGNLLGFSVVLDWDNYYRAAAQRFPSDVVFLVFSDDLRWCEEYFSGRLPRFQLMSGGTDIQDLFTLARCDHVIVSNSSFSYWGAALNQRGGMVVAPSRWRDVTHELDRFPEDIAVAAEQVSGKICLDSWIQT